MDKGNNIRVHDFIKIVIKIAEFFRGSFFHRIKYNCTGCHTCTGTDKLKQHQHQLPEIGNTGFTGIMLEVGIGNKTDRSY